ncbi:MAG: hypothetical protein M9901_12985 [Lentimicrobium sp.]|nr:hypothetical protein [Lentimicrobium sp.]
MKQSILLILLVFSLITNSFGQTDTIVLKIHPIIGDTIDAIENHRYKLFNENPVSFRYAVVVKIKNNVKAFLTYENDSIKVLDYSIEQVIQDGTQIDRIRNVSSDVQIENKENKKSAKLRVVYNDRNKRIRRHGRIRLVLYNTEATELQSKYAKEGLILAKLIQVNDTGEPSILVKLQQKGRPKISIPLINIKMIRFNTPTENILYKVVSVSYLTLCFFTTKASFSDPGVIPIAVATGIIGVKPLIKGNKRYDIGINSRFEIFY